ncbi:enoyl-[acyl-carrier-protein] reductase [NADH] [Enterococcus florum]|uniref:Enoyl-[acyl-carrier-protein] reductase [NADH] n=1 Tax=Enterococcus florum TaxID=2480627 RepID=A0A4P5PDK2_9ENTE|nr:enoyl-ACP reductase FabI [Enterococcus florum]GCF93642.1 enoyl-[acyl-carrier-protein] reductase [NADH] [Enterococcus florum]
MSFLTDKQIIVTGVANKKSIAWGCAKAITEQGGDVIYTYQNDRMKKNLVKLVGEEAKMVELDVSTDQNIEQAFQLIQENYGKIDGLVHSIAYANKEELSGGVSAISREGFSMAQDISAYSLLAITKYALPILNQGSSIVTLTYMGSVRSIPNYNMMGIAKAALEAEVRYLATELAPKGVRVNAISAGAIKTLAVTGVKDYQTLLHLSEERTPDKVSVTIDEVGNSCAFLLSPLASGIVGDIIYVDKGVHLS